MKRTSGGGRGLATPIIPFDLPEGTENLQSTRHSIDVEKTLDPLAF